jgi:hypothetical protein
VHYQTGVERVSDRQAGGGLGVAGGLLERGSDREQGPVGPATADQLQPHRQAGRGEPGRHLSYQDLDPGQQRLFRRLGLIPGPTFDAYAAAALDGASLGKARRQLDELYDQHLITEPSLGRYQLHDLLRQHARALAAKDDQADRDAAAGRVLDYYLRTALAAGRHFTPRASAYRRSLPGHPPEQTPDLATLGQSAVWLEAERANLHAAADHAATRGHSRYAIVIPPAMGGFLAARGHWDQSAAHHQSALAAAHQAGDRLGRPTRSARWARCSGRAGATRPPLPA